jgi:N12 class adenine-specific DNA methylase
MNLGEILRQGDFGEDEEATIFVERPWSVQAEAIIVSPAPATTASMDQDGRQFAYFIEAFIARQFLNDLAASCEVAEMSEAQRHEGLIRYAETDA